MSPVAASQDLSGEYTKKWVPELSKLSQPNLHRPWDAPEEILSLASVILGETYPHRIVSDLQNEREQSVENVLNMRRDFQQFNDKKGYDIIILPSGEKTVVFTKKEYRIDSEGAVIVHDNATSKKQSKGGKNSWRGRKGRQKVVNK
jgi:hypothetical protein